ncbi:hypothetical protein [Thiorhodococcus minor]|uniref:Uncharacterized protein n=1 Tax=Thiorhodococcus minor TaxID=57489 RepID=A0A6M0JWM5_9GAMM|nr:hypothetical protein [Thiorhodococcus minor]NEV61962.1 hypothetical protein [Thiorhodococcus minor]
MPRMFGDYELLRGFGVDALFRAFLVRAVLFAVRGLWSSTPIAGDGRIHISSTAALKGALEFEQRISCAPHVT